MITVINKGELWENDGEIQTIYLDVMGNGGGISRCIAKLEVRGKYYTSTYRGLTRKRTNAVMLHAGPRLTYNGCYAPDVILAWLNAMGANTVVYYGACRRAGWWK